MTKELKMTMKEVKEQLVLAIGEAFARFTKEKITGVIARPVKVKDWLGTAEDDLIPDKLDYSTKEDWISARITYNGKYDVTFFACDGMTFSIEDDSYWNLVDRFIEHFIRIYKA